MNGNEVETSRLNNLVGQFELLEEFDVASSKTLDVQSKFYFKMVSCHGTQ